MRLAGRIADVFATITGVMHRQSREQPMSILISSGAQISVNTTTASEQLASSVAALSGGGYVITWQSYLQDGSGDGIYPQRFDANGDALGAETRVNTVTSQDQSLSSVTGLADGSYVVTWKSYFQDGSGSGVYFQRYDASGNPVGAETRANTTTFSDQHDSEVTALSDGGVVVTWTSVNQIDFRYDIHSQRFAANGDAVGGETRVNATTASDQVASSIAALSDGGYVVTWESVNSIDFGRDIHSQRYDANGDAVGGETRVNTTTQSDQRAPSVAALAEGGYVVTWMSYDMQVRNYRVFAQRYDQDGDPLGAETLVNPNYSAGLEPAITARPDGGYVITWTDSSTRVFAQIYDAASNPVGREILVSGDSAAAYSPAVACLPDGRLVFTYSVYPEGEGMANGVASRIVSTGTWTGPLTAATEVVVGTMSDDTFTANPDALGLGDGVDGSGGINDALTLLSAGTLDFTKPTFFVGVEIVNGSNGDDIFIFNEASLADVQTIAGGGGHDILQMPFGDLSAKALTGIETIEAPFGEVVLSGTQIEGLQEIATQRLKMASAGTVDFGKLTGVAVTTGSEGNDNFLVGAYSAPAGHSHFFVVGGAGIDFASIDRSDKTQSFNLDLADASLQDDLGDGTVLRGIERVEFLAGSGADRLAGGALNDVFSGGDGTDIVSGHGGDDRLIGGGGLDTIDGGAGNDTAVFSGSWSDYAITVTGSVVDIIDKRTDSPDGADRIVGVENFEFADQTLALNQLVPNKAPTAVSFSNVIASLPENAVTTSDIKLASIGITDDGIGTNSLSLAGAHASLFKLVGADLYLKAGATLDFETAPLLSVTVNVDDAAVGGSVDASSVFNLSITNVSEGGGDPGEPGETDPPGLVITADDADGLLRKNETTVVTFDFSEEVRGFSLADIVLSSKMGKFGTLTQDGEDPTMFHATFTPAKNVSGYLGISVGNGYSDLNGNIGDAATAGLYVNTRNPLAGTDLANSISGTNNNDLIDGAGGNDTLSGRNGKDWLLGGTGADTLDGGSGDDFLFGGAGNDRLTGGSNADKFVFDQAGFGADQITDFNALQGDLIDLRGLELTYDDLVFSQVGSNSVITIGTDTITVVNVVNANLDIDSFLL